MDSHGRSIGVGVLVGALLLCLAAGASAQGLSDMRGTVADTSGGSLPGVTVTITNQASGTFREIISNADGSWYVPGLAPGTYQVSAELAGFKRFLRRDLLVAVGNTTTVPISLELGTLEETITVTGESPIIDVTSKQIGGNLRHPGPDAAAEHLAQLARLRRAVAGGRAGAEPGVVGLGDDLGQRRGHAQQLVPRRRRLGQRRLPGAEQRRPGARARSRACRNRRSSSGSTTPSSGAPPARSSTR